MDFQFRTSIQGDADGAPVVELFFPNEQTAQMILDLLQ